MRRPTLRLLRSSGHLGRRGRRCTSEARASTSTCAKSQHRLQKTTPKLRDAALMLIAESSCSKHNVLRALQARQAPRHKTVEESCVADTHGPYHFFHRRGPTRSLQFTRMMLMREPLISHRLRSEWHMAKTRQCPNGHLGSHGHSKTRQLCPKL